MKYSRSSSIEGRVWNWTWQKEDKYSLYAPSFHILYNLTTTTEVTIFQKFFAFLKKDHIWLVHKLSWADKWRLFVRYLGKAAGTDLFPFFQQWGLQIDAFKDRFIQTFYYLDPFPVQVYWGPYPDVKTAAIYSIIMAMVWHHSFQFALIRAFLISISVPFVIKRSFLKS